MTNKVVVIEYPDAKEWVVSFTNHNPSEDEYFLCNSKDDAFKLKALVDNFVDKIVQDRKIKWATNETWRNTSLKRYKKESFQKIIDLILRG